MALDSAGAGDRFWSALVVEVEQADVSSLFRAVERWDAFDAKSLSTSDRSRLRQDPVGFVWERIRDAREPAIAASWAIVHDALRGSSVFAFARDHLGGTSLHWCLAPDDRQSELAAAVTKVVDQRRPGPDANESNRWIDSWDRGAGGGGLVLVRLGSVPRSQLPAPVFLPTGESEIVALASEVISELARHLEWYEAAEDLLEAIATGSIHPHEIPMVSEEIVDSYGSDSPMAPDDVPGFGAGVWDEVLRRFPTREPSLAWLDPEAGDTARVKEGVTRACEVIAGVATRLSPRLIRDQYALDVSVTPQAVASGGAPVGFGLTFGGSRGGPAAISFGIDDAADGYRIWIQLALLQGIAAVRQLTHDLFRDADDIVWLAYNVAGAASGEFPLHTLDCFGHWLLTGQHVQGLEQGQQVLAHIARKHVETVRRFLAGNWPPDDAPVRMSVPGTGGGAIRPPFFVIDEPEQHLHPRAHRELATWLRDLVRVHDTQVVVVTHAVPFHQQADALVYVRRNLGSGTDARAEPIAGHEITALSEIAADLGVNRGELLTGIFAFLFVEGPSDQYVLEALFRERLRRIGAAVIPIHGVKQLRQILDATVLLRYSTAPIAFLVDDMDEYRIRALTDDPQARAVAMQSAKIEERELAKLLDEAIEDGRRLTVFGLPARDIFFLLEETAIRDTFRERAPSCEPYPGHDRLKELDDESGQHWKAICEQRFGIPRTDVLWYASVADRMKDRGKIPTLW